jgi:MFS family permease
MGIRVAALLATFSGLTVLLGVSTSLLTLALLMLLAGTLITPQATTHSTAVEIAAPKGTEAEAFAWVMTSMTLGGALGQAIGGKTVESLGAPLAFVMASGIGLTMAFVVWLRRSTLQPVQRVEEKVAL